MGTPLGRQRAATLTAYAAAGVLASTWGPRLPDLTGELRVGTAEIGGILAVANVGLLVGLMAAASITRALGARRTVGVALAVIVVCLAASAPAIALAAAPLLVPIWSVLGLATGVLDVVINAEGAGIEQRGGRSFLPLLHALWLGGAAAGAAIGAACAAFGITVAAQAGILSLLLAASSVLVVGSLPRSSASAPHLHPDSVAPRTRDRLRVWADPRLLALGVLIFGVELAEGSARTWMPLAVDRGLHESDAVAALFVTLFSVTTAGFRALGGPVVDRFGRVAVARATISIGVVGVVVFIVGSSAGSGLVVALIGTLLWAIGNCVAGPLAMSAAAEGDGDGVGRLGVVSTIGFAAGLVAPPLIGWLAQAVGILPAFWSLAIALVVALAASGSLRPRPATAP